MKYNLAACAIVKNESLYIEEWLEFHILQGVEHFYIYDNESTDTTKAVLEPYIRNGIVTYTFWPINPPQFKAYNDCLLNYGKFAHWMTFIDCDEFLYSPTVAGLQKTIQQILRRSTDRVGGIAAHWLLFGSNGHKEYSPGLVIERFNKRQKDVNHHVKSIVRPDVTLCVGQNPHYFVFKPGFIAINESGRKLDQIYGVTEKGTASVIRIAHFHLKSKAEYFKRKREAPDPGHGRFFTEAQLPEVFTAHDRNDSIDLSLQRFANPIKKAIAARRAE